jgi:hypothetical protein
MKSEKTIIGKSHEQCNECGNFVEAVVEKKNGLMQFSCPSCGAKNEACIIIEEFVKETSKVAL